MTCKCYTIDECIGADPQCEAHGDAAIIRNDEHDRLVAEVEAWRSRFPQYGYRPQDHGVFLK